MHLASTESFAATECSEEDAEAGEFDGEDSGCNDGRDVGRVEIVQRRFNKLGVSGGGVDRHCDGGCAAGGDSR